YKLKGVIDPQVATNLFASALIESANKARLSDTRPLKILSYLLKSGADHAPITKHLKNGELTKNEAAEIILKNIAHAKEGLLISKIPHFELERISLSSNDLISAIMDARLLVQKNNDLVVLVETPKDKVEKFGTLAVFTSENKENLEKISRAFNGSHKNKTALFSISSQNLKEAEDKMLKLARHIFKT
ncbi:hypothetical protein HY249_01295, partial [Candidatus Azambacteria bacterium]|nr:hypothetical protein [Candidatus Azambacteria bacterium]